MNYLYYISLGSNLGDREAYIGEAIRRLDQRAGEVMRQSSMFYSEPWGYESSNGFCNCCISLLSAHSPLDLLALTQQIERELGRTTKSGGVGDYHDRTIDIDLLRCFMVTPECIAPSEYTELTMATNQLTLPHPLMQQREFVMIPLQEIISLSR